MIQPNELRLGNWVYHNIWGDGVGLEWLKISALNENTVESQALTNLRAIGIGYDKLVPISITSEILEKFGFESTILAKRVFKRLIYGWSIYFENGELTLEDEDWSVTRLEYIKYIHQLQNLIFALTGEELKIQL